ncbi:lipopolysaccharide assembly protein LapB [Thermotoga sp. SG1]|uniref:tetratricopeptide repeat protein n=1 Tax=Thermotoga sp. SG1 TaxID=126739 RepID=UPI000C75E770|nr:tetratricopeptide repeat protein [Thermotoga sp. SG1]
MWRVALFFLFLSTFLLAISLDEIKEVSKTDLQKAINLFLNYVKENPSDPEIETVGELLFAKKRLVEAHPSLSKEISSEDLQGLMKKLKDETFLEEETDLLKRVFSNLESFVGSLQSLSDILEYPFFWKLNVPLKIEKPDAFAEELISRFFENPFLFSYEVISALSKIKNAEEIGLAIVQKIENLPLEEGKYPYFLRLFEIARTMGYDRPSALEEEIRKYLSLMTRLNSSISPEDSKEIFSEYESLTIPKENLRKKLVFFFSEKRARAVQNTTYIYFFLVLPAFLLFSARFRAFLYRTLGLKKRAASLYLKLLQKSPENVKLRLKLARLYEELGMHEKAMEEYEIIKKLSQV